MTAVEEHASAEIPAPDLNLLLEWPSERSHWTGVIAASLAVHAVLFLLATKLPSFRSRSEPERQVTLRSIPLYVPRDILTQKAPNRNKISKQIDLADLLAPRVTDAGRKLSE